MDDLKLTEELFIEFDQFDQFGFFYDEDGFEKEDSDETFEEDVKGLYQQYEYILVTPDDDIYGIKSGKRELIMEGVIEAYQIAQEVMEDLGKNICK